MKSRSPFIVTAGTSNATAEQSDAPSLKQAEAKASEWIAAGKHNVGIAQLTQLSKSQREYQSIPLPDKVQGEN